MTKAGSSTLYSNGNLTDNYPVLWKLFILFKMIPSDLPLKIKSFPAISFHVFIPLTWTLSCWTIWDLTVKPQFGKTKHLSWSYVRQQAQTLLERQFRLAINSGIRRGWEIVTFRPAGSPSSPFLIKCHSIYRWPFKMKSPNVHQMDLK